MNGRTIIIVLHYDGLHKSCQPESCIVRLNSLPFRPSLLSFYQKLVRLSLFILNAHLSAVSVSTITLEPPTRPLSESPGCQQCFRDTLKSRCHTTRGTEKNTKYKRTKKSLNEFAGMSQYDRLLGPGQPERFPPPPNSVFLVRRRSIVQITRRPRHATPANIRPFLCAYIFYSVRFRTRRLSSVCVHSNNVGGPCTGVTVTRCSWPVAKLAGKVWEQQLERRRSRENSSVLIVRRISPVGVWCTRFVVSEIRCCH